MGEARKEGVWTETPTPGMIAQMVHEAYRGPAWHGPTVRSALRGVTWQEAAWQVAPGRNSIWALVLHLAYCRHRVIGRIARATSGSAPRFARKMAASWFPELPERPGADRWREDLDLLEACQARLMEALSGLDPGVLSRRRKGADRPLGAELAGVAFHDAYHAGQIRLLAKLARQGGAAAR